MESGSRPASFGRPPSWWLETRPEPPDIYRDDGLAWLMTVLERYLTHTIAAPYTWEDLRTHHYEALLRPLVDSLVEKVQNPLIVSGLLALYGYYTALDADDDRHVNMARAHACEVAAWRFVSSLSQQDSITFLLTELGTTDKDRGDQRLRGAEAAASSTHLFQTELENGEVSTERYPLLGPNNDDSSVSCEEAALDESQVLRSGVFANQINRFSGLSALEIAAVSGAKKFLSQKATQRVINGIWLGDIIFFEGLRADTKKRAQTWDKRRSDPFSRLRVPRYIKVWEVIFFGSFLALYYVVIVQRNSLDLTTVEVLLLLWILAFAYDELGQYLDAGTTFYTVDFWAVFDLGIVAVGIAFFVMRLIGLFQDDRWMVDLSFDVLSLEALFLVPRLCSLLSLHPFFGTLIPCLKEMTRYSTQFLGLVTVLYLGFLTTFTLLARDQFSPSEMSWLLIKVFFGSSYLGFDAAEQISPVLGGPLMLMFVWMTNILLLTGLTSLLSNSLTEVMLHARDEYLFLYSIFVLEVSKSNKLTLYLPPLNVIGLLLRPLRLVLPAEQVRSLRIWTLKITHAPWVGALWVFENGTSLLPFGSWDSRRSPGNAALAASLASAAQYQPAARIRTSSSSARPFLTAANPPLSLGETRNRGRPASLRHGADAIDAGAEALESSRSRHVRFAPLDARIVELQDQLRSFRDALDAAQRA